MAPGYDPELDPRPIVPSVIATHSVAFLVTAPEVSDAALAPVLYREALAGKHADQAVAKDP